MDNSNRVKALRDDFNNLVSGRLRPLYLSVQGNVQRNAAYQRLGSSFVRGWQLAYLSHKEKLGVVVADSQTAPS